MNYKRIIITVSVSLITFLFIGFLVYVIYCYGYYDSNNERLLTEIYNQKKFDELYNNLSNEDNLSKKEFEQVISIMYDQSKLESIYNKYYAGKNTYKNINDFLRIYYFGNNKIERENIEYEKNGKTTLFKRATTKIKNINVSSKELRSELGINKGLKLIIDNKGLIMIDGQSITCENTTCVIEKIFKGIHEMIYTSNGYTYYGLLNIKSESEIDITNNDSLVTIEANNSNQKIKKGYYYLKACYTKTFCPSKKNSYIHIIDDTNVELSNYFPTEIATDYYKGKYEISNGFLTLHFESHTYKAYDYDTGSKTDIETNANMDIIYKIIDSENLQNDDYYYGYTE